MQHAAAGPVAASREAFEAPRTGAAQPLGACEPSPELSQAGSICPAAALPGLQHSRGVATGPGHGYSALGAGLAMAPPPARPFALPPANLPSPTLACSSQRDTLTGPSGRMLTSDSATEEKDEYLMRLLRKGSMPPAAPLPAMPAPWQWQALQQGMPSIPPQQPSAALNPQPVALPPAAPALVAEAAFRAPGPVRRAPQGNASLATAAGTAGGVVSGLPVIAIPPPKHSPARPLMRAASSSRATPSGAGLATVPSLASSPHTAPSGTTAMVTGIDQAVPSTQGAAALAAPATMAGTPQRPASGSGRTGGSGPTGGSGAGSGNAPATAAAATHAARMMGSELLGDSFAATRLRLGEDMAHSVRNTMIRQQVMFLEQLYDLHRAIAIQKLLMQNCPEVQQVMDEAMRLMSSVGSQHGSGSGRGSKRGQRTTPNGNGATVPGSGSGDPSSFRPDSQFAAVPQLPGEPQAGGVSGDDEDGSGDGNGSGSGQNGSGGGSTSPQHGAPTLPRPMPLPYMYLAHTAVATPSGASVAPNAAWPWGAPPPRGAAAGAQQEQQQVAPPAARGLPPVPQGPPQMAPWVGQDAGLAAVGMVPAAPGMAKPAAAAPAAAHTAPAAGPTQPASAPAAAQPPAMPPMPPMPFGPHGMMMMPPGMAGAPPGTDPLAWWYQNYYGAAAAAAANFQQAQHQMGGMSLATAQAAAATAAALMPPPPPQAVAGAAATAGLAGTGGATASVTRWWQDPNLTFGPAVDADMVARRAATATLASGREGAEVQSAPAGGKRSNGAGHTGSPAGTAPSGPSRRTGLYGEARMHLKRKAAAAVDADEASSGTTGHALGSHEQEGGVGSPSRPYKRQEASRSRGARPAPSSQRPPAAPAADGCGAQDENAAALLLAIGGKA